MKNALNWFDIPASDFERAKAFYEKVLDTSLETMKMENTQMTTAFLPADWESGVGGGITSAPGMKPSENGVLVFLNGGDDLSDFLDRVEVAGGKVLIPKTSLGDHGYMAQFIDSEGNRVGFHSHR